MKDIIVLDYANKTELVFRFLLTRLKELWPEQNFGDEWDFIEDICEVTSYRVTRPLFNSGFIIKQKLSFAGQDGYNDTLLLSVHIVSGLPELDISLITESLRQDRVIDGLVSITYRDRFDNTVTAYG